MFDEILLSLNYTMLKSMKISLLVTVPNHIFNSATSGVSPRDAYTANTPVLPSLPIVPSIACNAMLLLMNIAVPCIQRFPFPADVCGLSSRKLDVNDPW